MEAWKSIIRNVLLAIGSGGIVASHFSEQDWAAVVSGAMILISAIWKVIERRRHQQTN